MHKTRAAVVVLLTAAGAASAGPWSGRAKQPADTFAANYEPGKTVWTQSAPTGETQPSPATPTSEAQPGLAAPPSGYGTTEPIPAPTPVAEPAPAPAPAAPHAAPLAAWPSWCEPGGCHGGSCCPVGAARGSCVHQLIAYFSYCPLHKGVNCEQCCGSYYSPCCCYHCFPPLYQFFLGPCPECAPPVPPPYTPHPAYGMFQRLFHHGESTPGGCNCGS
jgi:hypothetical protein